jgi:hypothetical protein
MRGTRERSEKRGFGTSHSWRGDGSLSSRVRSRGRRRFRGSDSKASRGLLVMIVFSQIAGIMLHGRQGLDLFRQSIKAAGFAGGNLRSSLFFTLNRFSFQLLQSCIQTIQINSYRAARPVLIVLNDCRFSFETAVKVRSRRWHGLRRETSLHDGYLSSIKDVPGVYMVELS